MPEWDTDRLRANEWELLFQASRISPVLHEAVVMLQADFNALRREVDEQMGSKLEAQSVLKLVTEALDLRFDLLGNGWQEASAKILARIEEIVDEADRLAGQRDEALERCDALEEMQPFPVSTVMSWKRRSDEADARLAAVRMLLDPDTQGDPDEENVLRAFEAAGGRLT